MNTKALFFIRLFLILGLALTIAAADSASASNRETPNNLSFPADWLAFRPPFITPLAIDVTPPGDPTTTEAGTTTTISMVLDAVPSADVTIPVSSLDPTEGTVNPDQLVFTPANYTTPQDVTVTGQNDDVDDGDVIYTIQLGPATSTDTNYNGQNPDDIALTNTDNDTAGYTISTISGSTTEAGGQATFTIKLNTQPTADVTIGLSSSNIAEGTVSPASVTFNTLNWNSNQTVTVTGVDDLIDDGNIVYNIITADPTGGDATYNAINPADVQVTNIDNDTAGISVSAISGPTTEASGDVEPTFSIVLNTKPTGNVSIGLSSNNTAEGTVSPTSVSFNGGNWDSPQNATVTGVDDFIDDGNIDFLIVTAPAVGTGGNEYDGLDAADVAVTNTDNDTAGIGVNPTSGLVSTEATGDIEPTFTIVLNSQPTANVTIGLSSTDTSEGTVSPASITFTEANWNIAQTVTVTGVDDDSIDGDIGYTITTAAATSGDTNYIGVNPSDVAATNTDNDVAGITVSAISGPTTEAGGTATFTVVLDTLPTDNVSLGLSSTNTGEGTVAPASLTFTTTDWNTPQTVTVTGVNDDVDDGDIVYSITTAAATSADANYNGFDPSDVTVTNTDDDTAGITLTPSSGLITTEAGGTATFTVNLTSQPTADVTLALESSDTSEGTVTPATMTFTTTNWATTQTATVTGVDDLKKDGSVNYTIDVSVSSTTDTTYAGLAPVSASVSNTDDDTAGITVTPTSGLVTTEAGGTDTFSVVLNTEPSDTVIIGLTSSDESEGTISTNSLTFTTANWNSAQDVTITGVNDDIDDGDIAYTITTAAATSSDPDYNGLNAADVSVINTDNDDAGFKITPKQGLVTSESGVADTFEVVLISEPTTDVTLNLSSNDTTEGEASPASLTFTAADWDEPQEVSVVGLDDDQIDGDIAYKIVTEPAISDDPSYDGRDPTDVSVTNQDNDVAGITVEPTSGLITSEDSTSESHTDTFTITLDNQPTANVNLTLQSNDTTEGTVAPASLTFTPANWNTPQTVTVTGKNDNLADGNIDYKIITNPATSADPNYTGVDADDVSVTNADDDTPGFIIRPGNDEQEPLITTEGEASANINIVLSTEPTADVTFTLKSLDTSEGVFSLELLGQSTSVTFTPTNWDTVQTIQLIGVDDIQADGHVNYTVEVQSSSTDGDYDAQSQELFAINLDVPTIEWVLPPNHDPYYEWAGPDPLLLGVEQVGEESVPIDAIMFKRWNPNAGPTGAFEIILQDETPPYQFYFYPEDAYPNWNQFMAYANPDETWSVWKEINIYRLSWVFLPTIQK